MYDVIIVGKGPAGIAASLYTSRANLKTLVIGKNGGALEKTEQIQNYYGIGLNTTGKQLLENGWEQTENLGTKLLTEEVVGIKIEKTFIIKTRKAEYESKALLLATGTNRMAPKIEGVHEFEGRGVSYCATCDAFFYKGKNVGVIGNGNYAVQEAMELLPIAKSVTLLSNGKKLPQYRTEGINMNSKKIKKISGEKRISKIEFADDTVLDIDGIFLAEGIATSVDFARIVGAQILNNKIVVNENMETNIPGLYAAGDCTGGLLQISKAVYEGAKAGTEIIKYIRKEDNIK